MMNISNDYRSPNEVIIDELEAENNTLKAQITTITNLLRRVDDADYTPPDGVLRAIIEGDYADATAIMDEYEAALAQVTTQGYMKGSELMSMPTPICPQCGHEMRFNVGYANNGWWTCEQHDPFINIMDRTAQKTYITTLEAENAALRQHVADFCQQPRARDIIHEKEVNDESMPSKSS